MANKEKKITINALEKTIKELYPTVSQLKWHDLEIDVKKKIGILEMTSFVNSVVAGCFNENNEDYWPERKNFLVRACIVAFYTNLRMPDNVEKQYDMLYGTDLINSIVPLIDNGQFNSIMEAIDEKIDHIASANIAVVTKQINLLNESFSELQKQMSEIFSVLDANDVMNITNAFSGGKFDEEKLVKAFIKERYGDDGSAG